MADGITRLLHERVDHGFFGYPTSRGTPELRETIVDRLYRRYGWKVDPDQIMFFPGLVSAVNVVARATGKPRDEVLVQPPVYYPILEAVTNQDRTIAYAPLARVDRGGSIHYEIDFDHLNALATQRVRLFVLCNPHNPIGKIYRRSDLERLADFCERNNVVLCSDDSHCELLLTRGAYTPIASLSPAIASRTVTLMSATKTFNLSGLNCGFAIVQNKALQATLESASRGIVPGVNVMGFHATLAAFRHGEEWLDELRTHLRSNRDFLLENLAHRFPAVLSTAPDATYLLWLDCSRAGLGSDPHEFLLKEARVALSDGRPFGPGGEGCVRLNFACPRAMLVEALNRMEAAIRPLRGESPLRGLSSA